MPHKVYLIRDHEGPEGEWRYRSSLSLTSALDGSGWSKPRSGRFTPGKRQAFYLPRGSVDFRAGQDECEKSRFHLGVDPRTFQPVASSYTDYTGLLTLYFTIHILIMDGDVILFGVVYYQLGFTLS